MSQKNKKHPGSVSATQLADLLKPGKAKTGSPRMRDLGIYEHEIFHRKEESRHRSH